MPEVKVAEAPEVEIRATLINRFYPPFLVESIYPASLTFRHPFQALRIAAGILNILDTFSMKTRSGFKTSD